MATAINQPAADSRPVQFAQLSPAVRIAYTDSAPRSSRPVLLLIHGSPGSGEVLDRLAELLAPRYRVIVPDLPGFGASTRNVPDYSFRAHAQYALQMLDRLAIPDAHWLGFSMGGGVVLSVADLAPKRVRSLTMLSAIGVQEHELTGNYFVNRAIHGFQLAGLWAIKHGVPHFGLFDRGMFSVEYARNFFDSDQRPLRRVLETYLGPMLIVHGTRDMLVPIAAAREHRRLTPQSELVEFDGSHFMAFESPERIAPPIVSFLDRVDSAALR
ncbi:MAG: alpha/beta hydrolase [Bryobacteraceae bacterium]|nr:alpha/beta hydrolase [Bryobacteraceae bacterium]